MTDSSYKRANELSRREQIKVFGGSIVRTVLGIALIVMVTNIVPGWLDVNRLLPIVLVLVGGTVYVLFFRRQIKKIGASRYPVVRATEAVILVVTLFLAIFAASYVAISEADLSSFTEPLDTFTGFYFALTVLATVGFGDITPVSTLARSVAMMQMAGDLALIGVAVKVIGTAVRRAVETREKAAPSEG